MPFRVGQYVRYWKDGGICYGQLEEVKAGARVIDTEYVIRVGGTDTRVTVREGNVSPHPVGVASGSVEVQTTYVKNGSRLVRAPVQTPAMTWVIYKKVVPNHDAYLYHATALDSLGAIRAARGLFPRSRVDWKALGGTAWQGAEVAEGRAAQSTVDMGEHFRAQAGLAALVGETVDVKTYQGRLLGDVGEFLFAARRDDDVLVNYVMSVAATKRVAVLRFRPGARAWYQDPNSSGAVMTMNGIGVGEIEVCELPKQLSDGLAGDRRHEFEDQVAPKLKGGPWVALQRQE